MFVIGHVRFHIHLDFYNFSLFFKIETCESNGLFQREISSNQWLPEVGICH